MAKKTEINRNSVLQHWENKIKACDDYIATGPDYNLRDLEIYKISKFLKKDHFVIDFGCGTGKATYEYSKIVKNIIGIDFSPSMINAAKKRYEGQNIKFIVGDIVNPPKLNKKADIVMSTRCIINVLDSENQKKALLRMIDYLKPGGTILLMESYEEPFSKCDKLRSKFKLKPLERPWHNKFISMKDTTNFLEKYFRKVYASSLGVYYLLSRIVHPALVYPEEPKYKHKINKIGLDLAKMLDSENILGGISPITLIVGENKK